LFWSLKLSAHSRPALAAKGRACAPLRTNLTQRSASEQRAGAWSFVAAPGAFGGSPITALAAAEMPLLAHPVP
jgi:hypothetical protein